MSTPDDPKGLIREAYRIEGIDDGECRSILVDWALSLPGDGDAEAAVRAQYARYSAEHPDHPMTAVLREGLQSAPRARRRGGGRARRDSHEAAALSARAPDPKPGSGEG